MIVSSLFLQSVTFLCLLERIYLLCFIRTQNLIPLPDLNWGPLKPKANVQLLSYADLLVVKIAKLAHGLFLENKVSREKHFLGVWCK